LFRWRRGFCIFEVQDRVDNKVSIAIVGANDLVTEAILAAIADHPKLEGELLVLGEEERVGESVDFGQQTLAIGEVALCNFSEVDILISTGEISCDADWVGEARDAGCVILDVGRDLRGYTDLPPVCADVNPEVLQQVNRGSIVMLADAASVQSAALLKPLLETVGVERATLFSCHAVSEKGRAGVEEVARQTVRMLNGTPARAVLFPSQMAFNLVPRGVSQDEAAIEEIGQLLNETSLPLSLTSFWAPVFYGHTQSLHFSTGRQVGLDALKEIYRQKPYIEIQEDPDVSLTAVTEASGKGILVLGNLAETSLSKTDFSLLGVADNLRYGIAENAVKIVEVLVKRLFISYS
jgi:aspartate-semialdehyde dehydrogenase